MRVGEQIRRERDESDQTFAQEQHDCLNYKLPLSLFQWELQSRD
jgi:hypothetical protein